MADKRCRSLQTTKINQSAKNKSLCGTQPHQICLNIIALKAQGSQWMQGWKDCKSQKKKAVCYENEIPTNVRKAIFMNPHQCGFLNKT